MPDHPLWLARLPDIVQALEQLPSPWVERVQLEQLLGVKPRRAQQILAPLVRRIVGRSGLADRTELIAYLRALAAGNQAQAAQERRRQFAEQLAAWTDAWRSRPPLLVEAPVSVVNQTLADLPAGVRLAPGEIAIQFASPDEALQKLLQLAMAVSNQYEHFCEAVQGRADTSPSG